MAGDDAVVDRAFHQPGDDAVRITALNDPGDITTGHDPNHSANNSTDHSADHTTHDAARNDTSNNPAIESPMGRPSDLAPGRVAAETARTATTSAPARARVGSVGRDAPGSRLVAEECDDAINHPTEQMNPPPTGAPTMTAARPAALAVVLAALLCPVAPASAQAIHNLERNLPVEVQDTSPTDTGKVQLQGAAVNETSNESSDRFTLQPSVQWGFAENAHFLAYSQFYIADDDSAETGSGDVFVGMLYNFLAEGHYSPGLAVQGELVAPTGKDSEGLDTALTFIASKQITTEPTEDRLHFNVRWDHNSEPGTDERADRFEYVFGYSRKVTDKAVLVLDFFRREELTEDQESNMLEVGILYQLSQRTVIGAGLGTGIGDESPDTRFSVSLQFTLGS